MSLYSIPTQAGSAAIPIVAPTSEKEIPKNVPSKYSTQDSKARTCRNLIIHGYCKYEGKGCKFNHDINKSTSPPNSPETAKSKLSVNSPVFKPSTILSTISPEVVNAPPFIPKNHQLSVDETPITPPSAPGSPQQQLFDSGEHEYDKDISIFDPTIGFYPSQSLTSPKPKFLATQFSALDTLPDVTTHHMNSTSYFTSSHYVDPFLYQSQQTLIPQP
ncbi:323_t:CDS:2, partial [Scutellospora calospora]